MNSFISELYDYISQRTLPIQNDPEYLHAFKEYQEKKEEVKEEIGSVRLCEFEDAIVHFYSKQDMAIFENTLRFCLRVILSVWD